MQYFNCCLDIALKQNGGLLPAQIVYIFYVCQDLKKEFSSIQTATTELRTLTDDLAVYFCEDVTRFNIQDCFKCIIAFCKDLQKCHSVSILYQLVLVLY